MRPRIMIVDDEASICKALYDFLDDFDEFDLRTAHSAESALTELALRPDPPAHRGGGQRPRHAAGGAAQGLRALLHHQTPGRGYGAGAFGLLFYRHTQPQGSHARGIRPGRRHAVHRGIARDGIRPRIRYRRVPGWMSAGMSVANSGRTKVL